MWGCFQIDYHLTVHLYVFPTCVGVFLRPFPVLPSLLGLPHVCGGVSLTNPRWAVVLSSSPRVWGCFYDGDHFNILEVVFPTCVGVFPYPQAGQQAFSSLPHVCGGVSCFLSLLISTARSSPRVWGCFLFQGMEGEGFNVFPTCVGVFLSLITARTRSTCLPHVCGGVSLMLLVILLPLSSSPRVWGCFLCGIRKGFIMNVFPTCVGVFLCLLLFRLPELRLPHVCGGVSLLVSFIFPPGESSPRVWGCFFPETSMPVASHVFPTCVGVFPCEQLTEMSSLCLPHVCGGVSMIAGRSS